VYLNGYSLGTVEIIVMTINSLYYSAGRDHYNDIITITKNITLGIRQ
jgi:hypothetical protein